MTHKVKFVYNLAVEIKNEYGIPMTSMYKKLYHYFEVPESVVYNVRCFDVDLMEDLQVQNIKYDLNGGYVFEFMPYTATEIEYLKPREEVLKQFGWIVIE